MYSREEKSVVLLFLINITIYATGAVVTVAQSLAPVFQEAGLARVVAGKRKRTMRP